MPQGQHNFVEVIDANDAPFMLVPLQDALVTQLPCRQVLLILRHYAKDQLLLLPATHTAHTQDITATPSAFPSTPHTEWEPHTEWGILHTTVLAGESREGAAIRLIHEIFQREMAIVPFIEHMQRIHPHAQQPETGQSETEQTATKKTDTLPATFSKHMKSTAFFLFDVGKNIEKSQDNIEHLWLDFDEIVGLATHFEDMLSPTLLTLIRESSLLSTCQDAPRSA